jgi:hypothetical protein
VRNETTIEGKKKGTAKNSLMWNALRIPMKPHSRIVFDHLSFGEKNSETALWDMNKPII